MAAPSVRFHPAAVAEAKAAHGWCAKHNPSAATALMAALDAAVGAIRNSPGHWPQHAHGTRNYLLRRFPYAVIYPITDASVQVVAAHGRRRPGYWRRRSL